MAVLFRALNKIITDKMPEQEPAEAAEIGENPMEEIPIGIWLRNRLVKNASGNWVRVGRLRRVIYNY